MELINNIGKTLKDDLISEIKRGSNISIAAAYFSIYAFQELKKELLAIEELRFIFTSPTFITEKEKKEMREFYIPRLSREKSIYGTDFELKLKNELTQKAIAKECAEWIRKKVIFKSNQTQEQMLGFINVDEKSYAPVNAFTTAELGCEKGNIAYSLIQKIDLPYSQDYLNIFNMVWNDNSKLQIVTDKVIESISSAYNENSPEFIYFFTLYHIFNEFLEDISEDTLPNEATGFKESKIWSMLFNFQQDAVLAIINKLEKYNGCILADSVGLGKTFTALAVIKYYENRNKSVLVLCPKKLANNWNTYKDNYLNNPIASDRLRYDVLYHTDLSRNYGVSNGLDLDRLNWSNYDIVVIDESHNFRNGGKIIDRESEKDNRYLRLLHKVIRKGVKTRVLMLSATPVNNRFNDLKNQLQLAYEGNADHFNEKLNTKHTIDDIFKNAQKVFNQWCNLDIYQRTTDTLLKMLDFDFFEVLDSVTIARSRKHIEKYYDTSAIGKFPIRLKPLSFQPKLTLLKEAINYNEIFGQLMLLSLVIYTPTSFILDSKKEKYAELYEDNTINIGFTQASREQGIRRLTAINLMKRLESSIYSFRITLQRIKQLHKKTIEMINDYIKHKETEFEIIEDFESFDDDDLNAVDNANEIFSIGKKIKINFSDMDYISWREILQKDSETLELLELMVSEIKPEYDSKLQELLKQLATKINKPINDNNKKVLIFTAFSDTALYLYEHVSTFMKEQFSIETAMITGSVEGRTTIPTLRSDLNTVLSCFSPISKNKNLLMPNNPAEIDILIATDCISEGQNLQDCDYLINYDIHWNPVRIIQRFGRIDRIGSSNAAIQLVNFWPDMSLDEYIDLKSKIETRMKIVDMTATGDDNILNDEEKTDLEYRKSQLKRLQEEVVDIEEMSSGVSIMDLGLNEFRLDLLAYMKDKPELDSMPLGLHAVVAHNDSKKGSKHEGVLYVLKNKSSKININNQNRLHPFYMVFITNSGEVICNHLAPKEILDTMRFLCKGKSEAIPELYKVFNTETKDGRDMKSLSLLLAKAISSIIQVKEERDIDSFLAGKQLSLVSQEIKGLEDFELICFLVVK